MELRAHHMMFDNPEDASPISLDSSLYSIGGAKVWFCADCGRVRVAIELKRIGKAIEMGLKPNSMLGFSGDAEFNKIPYEVPKDWRFVKFIKDEGAKDVYFLFCGVCVKEVHEGYPADTFVIYEKEEKSK
jgi:hypothetical protein